MEVPGASTSSWGWSWRAGSSQEARGGAERRLHTKARKYPVLGQEPRPSTDSKAKVRREPWGGAAGPAEG